VNATNQKGVKNRKLRVLIADDSPVMRKYLREVFSMKPGAEVVGEAADGEKALEVFRKLKPDVLTLDIQMPKMGGMDVLRKISGNGCRVIFLTAYADEMYRKKCLELNVLGFYDKITEFHDFIEFVKLM
jgi:DNA-binding NarL/FixJ family response regulator